jgi:murein L,D-transpeptidase YafK
MQDEPAAAAGIAAESPQPDPLADPFRALDVPDAAGLLPAGERCSRVVAIAVEKRRRRLVATCEGGARLEFPAALGRRAFGSKDQAGDLRTPEGEYRVAESARDSAYHLFMLLDYPSRQDADRALLDDRISDRTYGRIATAHARGELPPQDTELGGRIGIHGEGAEHQGRSAREDWTFGCIALSDAHIEFLALRTETGTPVHIEP